VEIDPIAPIPWIPPIMLIGLCLGLRAWALGLWGINLKVVGLPTLLLTWALLFEPLLVVQVCSYHM
jgi:hypothetical protein